jgi:serine protease inhibitor
MCDENIELNYDDQDGLKIIKLAYDDSDLSMYIVLSDDRDTGMDPPSMRQRYRTYRTP